MTARLYGRSVGNGSLSMVTAGFRGALERAGLLEGFVALDRGAGSEEDESPPGALARDGIFTGNLSHVGLMRHGTRHERHWVTVTPNSNYLPRNLLAAVVGLPNVRILSASSWGSTMISAELYDMGFRYVEDGALWSTYYDTESNKEVRIHTVRHGVSGFAPVESEIEKAREDFSAGKFRVVHFSTTDGQRKGTLELVQAWKIMVEQRLVSRDAELLLVLDHHARLALQGRMIDAGVGLSRGIKILPRGDLNPTLMSRLLGHMHLVAAPSTGEGFGMIPLSARACGVPVVTTVTTGHSAGHCEGPGVVPIVQPNTPTPPPIDDGPGAVAQPVRPADIAAAISKARANWVALSEASQAAALDVYKEWRWDNQLRPLLEQLR